VVAAVGILTGLLNEQGETSLFAAVGGNQGAMLVNDYLAYVTGGPVFGDLLQTWLEYGGVLAACLVRKPASATIALTINGLCQVFVHGTHDPHLLYGVSGLGADILFGLFRYKRYDLLSVCLAGTFCGLFWYPIVWFTHGVFLYPPSFILPDFVVRLLGSAAGNGLLGGALALAVIKLSGRKWNEPSTFMLRNDDCATKVPYYTGLLVMLVGVVSILLTYAYSPVSNFFMSIGPAIPAGNPRSEEYNPGYVIGVLLIFLVLVTLAFWKLKARLTGEVGAIGHAGN